MTSLQSAMTSPQSVDVKKSSLFYSQIVKPDSGSHYMTQGGVKSGSFLQRRTQQREASWFISQVSHIYH